MEGADLRHDAEGGSKVLSHGHGDTVTMGQREPDLILHAVEVEADLAPETDGVVAITPPQVVHLFSGLSATVIP